VHPPAKELFISIIPTHVMNREIIPGRKREFDDVLYKLWPLLTWSKANRLGWLLAAGWLNTAPDSKPRLERARWKYPTSCSPLLTLPYRTYTHIHTHVPIPLLSLG